jgi:hypothetical protein
MVIKAKEFIDKLPDFNLVFDFFTNVRNPKTSPMVSRYDKFMPVIGLRLNILNLKTVQNRSDMTNLKTKMMNNNRIGMYEPHPASDRNRTK